MMKILHTIPYFNKASGGPTSCTYQLVKGLVRNSVDCDVLTFQPLAGDVLAEDKFIHYLPDDRKTPLWFSNNMSSELDHIIADYDLVHINTIWTWPSHIPVSKAKKAGKPIIISPHGMLYPQALKVSAWKKQIIGHWYVNSDLKKADCLHATCDAEADHLRSYGLKNPIAVIPNGIEVSNYPLPRTTPNSKRRFGFTGRLNPIKNVDLLLAAWNALGDRTNNAELVIIGDGDSTYVESLKNYVSQNNLSNVVFTGFLSGNALHDTVRSLDYLVLPSKSENFGMVVAEALISGVPVIASKGTPWHVLEDKQCGWWVEAEIKSITEAITEALKLSEKARLDMGAKGRDLVLEKFSSEAVSEQMTDLYKWILNKGDKPSFVLL